MSGKLHLPAWCSKGKKHGAAHYVLDDRSTACSHVMITSGELKGQPFLAPFTPTDWAPRDLSKHLCSMCRSMHPATCVCGRCAPMMQALMVKRVTLLGERIARLRNVLAHPDARYRLRDARKIETELENLVFEQRRLRRLR